MKLTATIEIPMGSLYKYEMNKFTKQLVLDRTLNQRVPFNYGYIDETLEEDGDPIDVFIMCEDPIPPLTLVKVEIYGVLFCTDSGFKDNKLLATIVGDSYNKYGADFVIRQYLETYKTGFVVDGYGDKEEALKIYTDSLKLYENNKT